MVRLSTVAVSTLVPALKVLSTTLPDRTFFSVVRTNAPPLPGLTCWNSTTVHNWPSMLSTSPFFRSLVVAMAGSVSSSWDCQTTVFQPSSLPGGHSHPGRARAPSPRSTRRGEAEHRTCLTGGFHQQRHRLPGPGDSPVGSGDPGSGDRPTEAELTRLQLGELPGRHRSR